MPCYPVSSGYSRPSGLKGSMFALHSDSYACQRTLFSLAPVTCLIPSSPLIIYSDFTSSSKDSILQICVKSPPSCKVKVKVTQLCLSNSLRPRGLHSPWNSPGQNTGVGSLPFLQRIFLTQESNWGLLHCRRIFYQLSYQGSPHVNFLWKNFSFSKIFLPFCMISAWWIINS